MSRTGMQRASFFAAGALSLVPLAFGVVRAFTSDTDFRVFWMAFIATGFAVGALATTIGRRRARRSVMTDAVVILVVPTLLAVATGFLLGATVAPELWVMALVFGICLATSSVLVAYSRPT